MSSTTGIELGPNTCLLAGVRPVREGGAEVFALHRIDAAAWPSHDVALSALLRSVRRGKRFPYRASVVAWGLPDGAVDQATARSALRPVEAAGFRIASVLTPPQALARLAGTRPRNSRGEAVAWLALNMHGAAIAIVRGSELLFARTFQWTYDPNLTIAKAQLLQRYSLIAHLAPELRRGIAAVRESHGLPVEAVVTCGDLPELRSLTMPLIEELDLEVETLDSTDGLHAARKAKLDRFAEVVPALRLACAAALTPDARSPRASDPPGIMRIAAAIALIAALAWGGYSYWTVSPARTVRPMPVPQRTAAIRPPAATARPPAPVPAVTPSRSPVAAPAPKPAPSVARREPRAVPVPVARAEPKSVTPAAKPAPPPATATVAQKPTAPLTRSEASRSIPRVESVPSATVTAPPEQLSSPVSDTRGNVLPSPATLMLEGRQAPLKEPLPKVDTVLIDQERRLALIDGVIVGVGDSVGSRVVVQIERDAVVLREPSGRFVRVRLRSPIANDL
jgi:hypothetical protein